MATSPARFNASFCDTEYLVHVCAFAEAEVKRERVGYTFPWVAVIGLIQEGGGHKKEEEL